MAIQRGPVTSSKAGPTIDAVVVQGEVVGVAPPRQGWLGVMVCAVPLAPPIASQVGQHAGLLVQRTAKGSPAARCGIRAADVLLRMNGMPVTYDGALRVALTGRRHGEPVAISLWRDGRVREVRVVPGTEQ